MGAVGSGAALKKHSKTTTTTASASDASFVLTVMFKRRENAYYQFNLIHLQIELIFYARMTGEKR